MKKLQSFNSFISERKTDMWSPYQKADILAGDMFGEMGLFSLRDDQLDQIIDLKKADKLAKKHFGEFGFKTLAAKEMEELIDNNPKLLRESVITENKESMKIDSYLNTKDESVLVDFLDDAYGNSDDKKTRKEWEAARNDLSYSELVDYAIAHAENFGMDLQDIQDAIEVYEHEFDKKNWGQVASTPVVAEAATFLTEGKWSNIMKGVRKGAKAGPWAIVSIENGKVINQELVSIMDAIPAHYEAVKKEFPKAKLSIEDNEGHIVYNESLLSEKFYFGKKDQFNDNDINDVYGFYGTLDSYFNDAQKEEFWKNTFSYLASAFNFTDEGALYFLNAKIGRWLADQFTDGGVTTGNDGIFDIIDNFAKSSQWKRWAKEYNELAKEDMTNESVVYETCFDDGLNEEKSSTEVLADDVSGELYTATLKGKSVTIKATTTTKTWDDGVPVLKYLARGKGKPTKVEFNRSFDVVHDVAHGWFYFTDGRKWFGLHVGDGYHSTEDLPFDVTIKESVLIKEAKMDRDDFMDHLKKKFSIDFISTTEEFNGSEGGVWVSGESGDVYKGKIIYDYYSEDHKNYELGVLNRFEQQINKIGWYSEWYDAGTVMIWPL